MTHKEQLRRLLVKVTGCSIQHTGWPCNTCFHSLVWVPLSHNVHAYWIAVLSYRGDYPNIPRNRAMNNLLAELLLVLKEENSDK